MVASLGRPGGNVTGLSGFGILGGKRLQLLRDLVPGKRVIAVPMNPDTPFTALAVKEVKAAAEAAQTRLEVLEARTADQVPGRFEAASKAGATGLIVFDDPLMYSIRRRLVDLAARFRLPTIFRNRDYADAGGLMSYGTDRRQLYRRAAEYVDTILRGARPAGLAVEQSSTFELVLNLKTAKALGLTIPQSVRLQADQVIE